MWPTTDIKKISYVSVAVYPYLEVSLTVCPVFCPSLRAAGKSGDGDGEPAV